MPELIDRWAALEKMCNDCKSGYDGHCPHPFGMCHEYESILQVPTIEPEERHGRWIEDGEIRGIDKYKCSLCGGEVGGLLDNTKYCCFCGAKMDGGAENG